jgi:hypothetical protein
VQPVREAMSLDRVETLEVEQRIDEARSRRIAVIDGHHVGAKDVAEVGLVAQRILVGLADQVTGELGMIEALGDPMDDRILEPLMMQYGRVDEGRKFRLAPDDVFRLLPHMRPDRVELAERGLGVQLSLGHVTASPQFDEDDHTT